MAGAKSIVLDTQIGTVTLTINEMMDKKNITVSQMSRISGLKFDVVSNYYYNKIHIYNAEILAKFCKTLNCKISDLITYIPYSEK